MMFDDELPFSLQRRVDVYDDINLDDIRHQRYNSTLSGAPYESFISQTLTRYYHFEGHSRPKPDKSDWLYLRDATGRNDEACYRNVCVVKYRASKIL